MDFTNFREFLGRLAGLQFEGKRDLYKVFGYKNSLTYDDYFLKYERQDIAKRIVGAPASATWRNPPKLSGPSRFVKQWDILVKDMQLWGEIERADRLAGIGNYAVVLLGFDDSSNTEAAVTGAQGTKLLYVQPYSQKDAKIVEIENDTKNWRFGLPKMYEISIDDPANLVADNVSKKPARKIKVHHSRVLHIAEDLQSNNFIGTPRLKAVFNILDDLLKVSGGTAETYWLTANRGMQVDIDKDAEMSTDDANALSDEIDEYQNQLRRVIKTKGVKINSLGSDTPNPKEPFDIIIALISGATGIPRRVLTGSEAGQLASDQDRANWADRIKERRITFAEPNVLNPLLSALMEAGVLPTTTLTALSFNWPVNFQLTPLEEAQTMAQKARAVTNLQKCFPEGTLLLSVEESRSIVGFTGNAPKPVTPGQFETPQPEDPDNILDEPGATDTTVTAPEKDPNPAAAGE